MKNWYIIMVGFFALISVTSCKKKDLSTPITVQNLAGAYKLTAQTAKDNSGNTLDLYAHLDDCEKDDLDVLYTSMNYEHQDAGTQCNPPDDFTGTWSLTGNNLFLGGASATIQKFDGKTLVISYQQTDQGIDYTVTSTYVKQ